MKQLVFVHGRAQQHKDAKSLKDEWIESWKKGLKKSALTMPLSDEEIRFPYYGQTLFDLSEGKSSAEAADIIIKGLESDEARREFITTIINEARLKVGIKEAEIEREIAEKGALNWGWVQAVLQVLDNHAGISAAGIALATNDVHQYLYNQGFRDEIEEGVAKAIKPNTETVVVSHSLGTVVAFSVLRNPHYATVWKVPLFVTLGSPLGVKSIRGGFEPLEAPRCVGHWYNAMDERDVVALYPLRDPHFSVTPEIQNKTDVNNHTENRHGIAGYLEDPEIANRIYEAVL